MPDDLDNLIRTAMKTLDEGVPSGYFEALPNRTLARLEGSMQHGSSGTDSRDRDAQRSAPPMAVEPDTSPVARQPIMQQEREEDSGLHDIRNLAQSTKQRLSRKITAPPIADDVLSASSGAFKNIALPQPAKMVSLPSIDELPSKAEVAAAEKAAKKAAKESKKEEVAVAAIAAPSASIAAPAAAPVRQAFTLPSQQRKGSKGPLLAILGLGVAAAAGGVIYMQMTKQSSDQAASSAPVAAAEPAKAADNAAGAGSAAAITAQPIEPAPAAATPPEGANVDAVTGAAGAAAQIATDDVKAAEDKAAEETKADEKAGNKKKPSKTQPKAKVEKDTQKTDVKPVEKVEVKKPDTTSKTETKGGEGEPSFDALLKEAGVSDQKKDTKPKLDKKSLTRDDFMKGMGGPATKAKGCYKGTQGNAMVKLTIAPSGSVSKVTVSGDFAGKPEGSCVEGALKSATFPPWDGGPQSFTYSVLLSD